MIVAAHVCVSNPNSIPISLDYTTLNTLTVLTTGQAGQLERTIEAGGE